MALSDIRDGIRRIDASRNARRTGMFPRIHRKLEEFLQVIRVPLLLRNDLPALKLEHRVNRLMDRGHDAR
jgi:hypothetical protein